MSIKVKPPVAPAAQVTTQADAATVTDARGRVIALRRPNVLAQYRMVEAMGKSAENQVYMAMVMPLIYVASIDGDPVPPAATKAQIEALVQRLDEDGLAAVTKGIEERFLSDGGEDAVKKP